MDEMAKAIHYHEVDPGIHWVKDADVAIDSDGPLDANRTLTPNVVEMDGGYRMYYHGFGPQSPNPASKGYILSAFSADAGQWEKEPGVRLDAGGEGAAHFIWSPEVIPLPDGGYRMYVEGRTEQAGTGAKSAIISALSADGLVWQREPGVRLGCANTSYGAPRCLYLEDGPRYRLYASASPHTDIEPYVGPYNDHHIVSAISDDGLNFEMESGIRIAQESALESFSVYAPEVLRLGTGGYRMYYAGWVSRRKWWRDRNSTAESSARFPKTDWRGPKTRVSASTMAAAGTLPRHPSRVSSNWLTDGSACFMKPATTRDAGALPAPPQNARGAPSDRSPCPVW